MAPATVAFGGHGWPAAAGRGAPFGRQPDGPGQRAPGARHAPADVRRQHTGRCHAEFSILERELTGRFNFIHVGGDSKRKNAQMAVDAFLELYDGNDDFRLILKYNKYCYAEVYLNGQLVPASHHPQIISIPENISTDDLVSLYHKCHCMIYPTMGEGFGLIPFESIATGLPTIVTNLTGCADFANYGIPLEAELIKADWQDHLYDCDTGEWASPDFEQLLQLMEHVVNEYDDFKKYAVKSARIIHSEWSWASVADKILQRLEFYEKSLS